MATAQLLAEPRLDFIVYDYLAEITMAILARARARDPKAGYATDFVSAAMAPNLAEIARKGVRIISNAGGVNPEGCAAALRLEIARQGLNLGVVAITGDDLMGDLGAIAARAPVDMFTRAPFPDPAKVGSVNAYLGAFAIAAALKSGADIVVTGRCVDSAVTLGAAIAHFGWQPDDLDRLAGGALAGHILECGTQATGGNFTDWSRDAEFYANMGYPIAEIAANGSFDLTKPAATGGMVSRATVAEQLVYEIGDPAGYLLPDVACDFTGVTITETGENRVHVGGAKGRFVPESYKICLTWQDGFRGGHVFTFYGPEAEARADVFAKAVLLRARRALARANAPDFTEVSVEIIGAESQFGAQRAMPRAREVALKIAVRHPAANGIAAFIKEATGLGLSAPPGLSGFAGARPKPSPVMVLFSFLAPKGDVQITLTGEDGKIPFAGVVQGGQGAPPIPASAPALGHSGPTVNVPLIRLAWGRSGDKGDSANIGIIARDPAFMPWIWAALDPAFLRATYGHFMAPDCDISRFYLPGISAMNILLDRVLGGGGTSSLRNDPQAKGYAGLLLAREIPVARGVVDGLDI